MLRFGKAVKKRNGEYRVANPGFRVIIPWVDKFAETHVRQRIINLPSQVLTLPDRSIFDVSAVLRVSVQDTPQDLYSALFATNGLNKALEDAGLAAVRDVLAKRREFDTRMTPLWPALEKWERAQDTDFWKAFGPRKTPPPPPPGSPEVPDSLGAAAADSTAPAGGDAAPPDSMETSPGESAPGDSGSGG